MVVVTTTAHTVGRGRGRCGRCAAAAAALAFGPLLVRASPVSALLCLLCGRRRPATTDRHRTTRRQTTVDGRRCRLGRHMFTAMMRMMAVLASASIAVVVAAAGRMTVGRRRAAVARTGHRLHAQVAAIHSCCGGGGGRRRSGIRHRIDERHGSSGTVRRRWCGDDDRLLAGGQRLLQQLHVRFVLLGDDALSTQPEAVADVRFAAETECDDRIADAADGIWVDTQLGLEQNITIWFKQIL